MVKNVNDLNSDARRSDGAGAPRRAGGSVSGDCDASGNHHMTLGRWRGSSRRQMSQLDLL